MTEQKATAPVPEPSSNATGRPPRFTPTMIAIIVLAGLPMVADNANTAVVNNSYHGVITWFSQEGVSITTDLWSTYVSMSMVGTIVGSVLTGPVVQTIGPRTGIACAGLLSLAAGLMNAFCGSNFVLFCAARGINGAILGFNLGAINMYVGETSPPQLRGQACILAMLIGVPGMVLANTLGMQSVLGTAERWRPLYWMFNCLAVPATALLLLLPESPRFLLARGRTAEAHRSLRRILAKDDVTTELEGMQAALASNAAPHLLRDLQSLLLTKTYVMPLLIGLMFPIFVQFSGGLSLFLFSTPLLVKMGIGSAEIATVIISAVGLPGIVLVIGLIDRVGRRRLIIGSWVVCALLAVAFALLTIYRDASPIMEPMSLVVMMLYIVALTAPGMINMMLSVELFPTHIRPVAVSVCNVLARSVTYASVKSFLYVVDLLQDYVFFFYAAMCLLGVLFVHFCIPETQGTDIDRTKELFEKKTSEQSESSDASEDGKGASENMVGEGESAVEVALVVSAGDNTGDGQKTKVTI